MNKNYKILSLALILGAFQTGKAQCPVPSLVTASPATLCAGATTSLNATAVGAAINWYTVPSGGTPLGSSLSGANYSIVPVNTTTYYAESFVAGTITLNYTGAFQNFTVPAGVTTLTVDLRGAKGGTSMPVVSQGGNGGRVTGTITVVPGQVLQIFVGGIGANGNNATPALGGFNGGGNGAVYAGAYSGGGGGGASDIRISPYALANRVAIAGGGGGGAFDYNTPDWEKGGMGGGLNGEGGYHGNVLLQSGYPGGGASQIAGGAAGNFPGYCVGNAGVLGIGGAGGPCTNSGGGGGGGFYGGGGGVWGGGGGGSSFLVNGTHTQGFQSGNGQVILSYASCVSISRTPVTVTVNANPTITVNSGSICSGQSFTMVPGGANTYTFQGGNAIVSPTTNTNYTVTGTSTAGCVSQSFVTSSVIVVANPTISVNSGSICSGNSFTMVPSGANTYTFQGGSAIVSPTANASYTVIGTSTLTGCSSPSFATSNVTVNTTPTVGVTGNTLICGTGTNVLTGTGANTYSWSTGANTSTISVSPTVTTNYTVVGTNTLGSCVNTFTTSVLVSTNPTLVVTGGTSAICVGSTVNLTANGANTYSWSNGPTTNTIAATPTTNTSYTVVGTNTAGCSSNAVANVTVNALPTVAIAGISTICKGETSTLTASGADTYSWNTGATTSSISVSPSTTIVYTATGTSSTTGCSNTTTLSLVVNPCTGINTVAAKINGLLIYPNPSNGEFTIELNNGLNKTINITDVSGRTVYQMISENDKTNVNITNLSSGIYFVKIQSNNATEIIKVVKQ